jgi:hypothetical protein
MFTRLHRAAEVADAAEALIQQAETMHLRQWDSRASVYQAACAAVQQADTMRRESWAIATRVSSFKGKLAERRIAESHR